MSLEAKIAELTLAVQALTHAFTNVNNVPPKGQEALTQQLKPETLTGSQQADVNKYEAQVKAPNGSSTPESGAQCEPARGTSLTYDDVKRATNNLSAAKGKEITIAALARFGVKRATELTESQWQEYCNYTVACIAGLDPREAA